MTSELESNSDIETDTSNEDNPFNESELDKIEEVNVTEEQSGGKHD